MGFKNRLSKLNLSGIGAQVGRPFQWIKARMSKLRRNKTAAVSGEEPTLLTELKADSLISEPPLNRFKAALASIRVQAGELATTIKNKFPKNLEDLKRLQSDEAMDRARQLFSGGNAATYLRLGAAAFAAYFLADTVSLFTDSLIPDAPPVPAPRVARQVERGPTIDEYAAIIQRNIFNSQGLIPEPASGSGGPARKTNLPFTLVGTVVLQDELKSIAAIEDKSQNLVFPVRVEDTISDKVKITKIERFRVYFQNKSSGFLEYVEIIEDLPVLNTQVLRPAAAKSDEGIAKVSDTNFEIESKVISNALGNFSETLQQARAIPNFENGMPDGYKIIQIIPDSIYEKLGIQNGDVVCGVNRETINDPGKAFQFFNDLKSARHVEICVKRGGRKMTMNYDIK